MSADATINLNAVDNTRAAFLSVKRNMNEVGQSLQFSERGAFMLMRRFVGFTAVAGTVASAFQDVWTNAEKISGLDPIVAGTIIQLRNAAKEGNFFTNALKEMAAVGIWGVSELKNQLSDLVDVMRGQATMEEANQRAIQRGEDALAALNAEREKALKPIKDQMMLELTQGRHMLMTRRELMDEHLANMAAASERADALRAEGKEMEALVATLESYRASNNATREEIAIRREESIKAAREEDLRARSAREAGKILANGFEDAVFSGEKLSKVISQLGKDIMRMMFRNMITTPLANALTGGIKSIFGFADGGMPPTNRPSIVGERGPELFVPGTSGRIVPNHQLSGGGGGGNVYNIDARGADQTGLARLENMIRETRASIRPIALSSVANARARGGFA